MVEAGVAATCRLETQLHQAEVDHVLPSSQPTAPCGHRDLATKKTDWIGGKVKGYFWVKVGGRFEAIVINEVFVEINPSQWPYMLVTGVITPYL